MNYILLNNISLIDYNTLRLKSSVKNMAFVLNPNGLKEIHNIFVHSKKIVIGKGSNVLLSKEYYDDNYVFINFKFMDSINFKNNFIYVESGARLSDLSWFCIHNNISGYEFLEDIPGTVGGAVIMNAGTYKDNIEQLLHSATYYDPKDSKLITRVVKKTDFAKRSSYWKEKGYILLNFEFKKNHNLSYQESLGKILDIKKRRYDKQPRNYPNAGSVFKRPFVNGKELYVWKLVEDSGLKGLVKNGAMISEKHTGFIVNINNAKFNDVNFLIKEITSKVKNNFNVDLELEWEII